MAIPAYDPYGWSTTGNTLQDLYQYYLTGGDDTAADTTDATTASGIAGIYPYSQIGGDGGGVEGTPLIPRPPSDIYQGAFDRDDVGTIYPDIAPYGPYTTSRDWDLGVEDVLSPNQLKDPNLLVKGMNWLTRRPKAIESFAGGKGGAGSRAGLYSDEVLNLETVSQAGFLSRDNPGQDIFGVNVVSAFGNYEKKQQEIKDFYDAKSKEELETLMKSPWHRNRKANANSVVNANSAIATAKTITKEIIEEGKMTDKVIKPPEEFGYVGVREMQEKAFRDLQAKHAAAAAAEAKAQIDYHQWRGGKGAAEQGQTEQAAADVAGGSAYSSPFSRGGRVRYAKGGIVDLL